MSEGTEDVGRDTRDWLIPALIVLAVIGLWLAFAYSRLSFAGDKTSATDRFGALTALFSGLALGGVVYAIILQRNELRLQRLELALTRRELEGQKEALTSQNATLKEQNFEQTFFQLLRLLNEITAGIQISTNPIPTKGRDCFAILYDEWLRSHWHRALEKPGLSDPERIILSYGQFYEQYEGQLGHYFRTLYNLVKFVDRSGVDDKRLYTNLIRAQLSSYELLLLFYNALSEKGREKFKPLIEQYSLLKMLPRTLLFDSKAHPSVLRRGRLCIASIGSRQCANVEEPESASSHS